MERHNPAMARDLDLLTLRLFVAVCEEGNIARAARREALVPSAVSKRILAVEAQVGAPLLQRGRRGVAPTSAGQALLRQAREVLGLLARMQAELGEFGSGVQGSVRVLASVSVLAEHLPDDIARFLRLHEAVRISLDECLSADIVRNVQEGAADLGVLWDLPDLRSLHTTPYRQDHLCVLLPPGHALAGQRRLAYADTLAYPAVGMAPGGLMDRLLRRQAALAGHTLNYRIQVSSLDAACRIVAAGLGLAVLPRQGALPYAHALGLKIVPLQGMHTERRLLLAMRNRDALSPAAAALLRMALARLR